MPGPAAIFREIHRLKRHAKDLQDRIELGPRQLKAQAANVAKKEDELRQAQDTIKQLKVTMHQDEVSLKSTQQQLAKHQKQMNEATVKKEYDALKIEIDTGRKENSRLEDAILEAMGAIEERTSQVPALQKAVEDATTALGDFERDSESRRAVLSEQLRRAFEQIVTAEATLPEATREQYDRLVRKHGEDAMSQVVGQSCVACYTEITVQNSHDLRMGQFFVCKSCGRILYLAE